MAKKTFDAKQLAKIKKELRKMEKAGDLTSQEARKGAELGVQAWTSAMRDGERQAIAEVSRVGGDRSFYRRRSTEHIEDRPEYGEGSYQVGFTPTDATESALMIMQSYRHIKHAKKLTHDAVVGFVNGAALRAVMEARGALGTEIGFVQKGTVRLPAHHRTKIRRVGKPSRNLRIGGNIDDLKDTGGLAEVFSARWRGDATQPEPGKIMVEFGPFGRTNMSTLWGIPFTDPDEHPVRFWATSPLMSSASGGMPDKRSKLTYAELAWTHELGYKFKITPGMVALMKSLALGKGSDGKGDPKFGEWAKILYFGWTKVERKQIPKGSSTAPVHRVPKRKTVHVAPRPWMGPAISSAVKIAKKEARGMASLVFHTWTQYAAGSSERRRGELVDRRIARGKAGVSRGELRFGVTGKLRSTAGMRER